MTTLDPAELERAFAIGNALDLSGCVYGPAHWQGQESLDETLS